MLTSHPTSFTKHEIYVNEIEFARRDEVALFGFLHHCGKFFETQYIISRKDLQILLSNTKPSGIEILWQIENLFAYPHSIPASLNLISLFGTTQVFDTCQVTLSAPLQKDEQGNLTPCKGHGLLFVEEVIPLNPTPEVRKPMVEQTAFARPVRQTII